MADLTRERMRVQATLKYKIYTLKSTFKAYKGHGAALRRSDGKVQPFDNSPGLVFIGVFAETVDATSADKLVNVDLCREVQLEFFENDATSPVSASTGILGACYQLDNHTVTADPEAGSLAGLVWVVDSRGVGIERVSRLEDAIRPAGPALSYTSNDAAPAAIVSGAVYDVPTTAANSTITLPAAAPDGTWAIFVADGTKNGHTVQYRDATGPASLTTALTASKRHMVHAQMSGGKWFANAYVSP
jgi:hypothetical protein